MVANSSQINATKNRINPILNSDKIAGMRVLSPSKRHKFIHLYDWFNNKPEEIEEDKTVDEIKENDEKVETNRGFMIDFKDYNIPETQSPTPPTSSPLQVPIVNIF